MPHCVPSGGHPLSGLPDWSWKTFEQQLLTSMQCVLYPGCLLGAEGNKGRWSVLCPQGVDGQTCPLREHRIMLGILLGSCVMSALRMMSGDLRSASMGDLVRLREGKAFPWEAYTSKCGRQEGIGVFQNGESAFLCRVEGSLEVRWLLIHSHHKCFLRTYCVLDSY